MDTVADLEEAIEDMGFDIVKDSGGGPAVETRASTGVSSRTSSTGAGAQSKVQVTLRVTGMTCGSCVRTIEDVLRDRKGVVSASVSLQDNEARITYDSTLETVETLIEAIEDCGFDAYLPNPATPQAESTSIVSTTLTKRRSMSPTPLVSASAASTLTSRLSSKTSSSQDAGAACPAPAPTRKKSHKGGNSRQTVNEREGYATKKMYGFASLSSIDLEVCLQKLIARDDQVAIDDE